MASITPVPFSKRTHILVVDDEPEIAESLADFLTKKEGYKVTIANDGREAIDFLQATIDTDIEVDLILLDMRMPEVSGLDVLAWMRSHPIFEYTRVVLLTAVAGNNEKVDALSAGADDYITKPYYPDELLARVKTILRTQQLEKQLQQQRQQLAALNRVGQRVAATLDTQEMLQTAVMGMSEVIGVELSAILIKNGRYLQCRYLYSRYDHISPEDYPLVPQGQGITGMAFHERTAVLSNYPGLDPRYQTEVDAPRGFTVNAIISIPILVHNVPSGTLNVLNKRGGAFTEVDLDLLASLATSISETLENIWLLERIRESRNTLQALIDGILHHIYTIDEEWKLVSINQSKSTHHQVSSDELTGKLCYQAFFNRQTPCEHCLVDRTLKQKKAQQWSLRWFGNDHLLQEREIQAYPIPGVRAGSARAVIVWEDRTEARRLENSLRQANKLAAVGQLAAGVAHEINNPLTAINANAQLLKMLIPKTSENYESVDLIFRAGERAATVVRDLLNFARQEKLSLVAGNVNMSVQQALNLVNYELKKANIQIVSDMDPRLPDITASWEHLKGVWINLLVNARDAVEHVPKDRRIELTTRVSEYGKYIEVIIHDNGKGMSEAELKHIFEPFYTTKDPSKGTGLGLAINHRIVEQHQGEINVASTVGKGTTFLVRLPIQVEKV